MNKIAVITSTRAEFGLLSPVVIELRKYENESFRVDLVVTGTHLSEEYGMTVSEIESMGARIDHKIQIPVYSDSGRDIAENQATTLIRFTELFLEQNYDALILLGDRYEMLAIAIAAGNTQTPIFHLCGGDTTEGALDEWIRHSITKISYLHFVTNEESRNRVIQLGESPERVFNYGSTSIDNILTTADLSVQEALESIGITECKYAVCTYHPVTMDRVDVKKQVQEFLSAISLFPELTFIITKSNSDQGGSRINALLDEAERKMQNIHVFASLGVRRYLSLMRHSEFVLGNSSSGIIETPAFHIPTVNIGDRQRGRLQSESIINCASDKESIVKAIRCAISKEHRELCKKVVSPYGSGHAAVKIARKSVETVLNNRINLKKKFYNIDIMRRQK